MYVVLVFVLILILILLSWCGAVCLGDLALTLEAIRISRETCHVAVRLVDLVGLPYFPRTCYMYFLSRSSRCSCDLFFVVGSIVVNLDVTLEQLYVGHFLEVF